MPENYRLHGEPPYSVVAVHGGPGAIGEARPFALELSKKYGVVEPLLLTKTLEGNITELQEIIETKADGPVTLIGHSYGAALCYLVAARYPELVKKLIMLSSSLLEQKYVAGMLKTRLSRMTPEDAERFETELGIYRRAKGKTKTKAFVEMYTLIQEGDAYDLIPHKSDLAVLRPKLYDTVWEGMQALREADQLAPVGKDITCPVVAIHGDYDPRPAQSIHDSLAKYVKDLRFIVIEKCGHYPWYEQRARDNFYAQLLENID